MKRIVTIDGPAGSGKSTIAKLLAKRLSDFIYLDTGAIYRAITHFMISQKISSIDAAKINENLKKIHIKFDDDKVFLNGEDISSFLREKEVAGHVATFAKNPDIRKYVRKIQRNISEKQNVVVDGRDVGTVVFPVAFCKFYLDANVNVRAKRRLKDEKEAGSELSEEEIKNDISKRDNEDKSREESPLVIPGDAHLIDSSEMNTDDVMIKMVDIFNHCIAISETSMNSSNLDDKKLFLNALDSMESETIEPGTLLKGKIVELSEQNIVLDIGSKRDGIISAEESEKIRDTIKVGQIIDVYVLRVNSQSENILISKLEADRRSALIKIKELFEKGEYVEGIVKQKVKGGFIVDIDGNSGFCPLSEFDVRRISSKDDYIDQTSLFAIIEFNVADKKLVVSRKRPLEKQYNEAKEKFFNSVNVGDVLSCTVATIVDYGVFVEFEDGISTLMRTRNISWKRFANIKDILTKGDKLDVKVIDLRADKQKIEVSRKELEVDPFDLFLSQYSVDDIVSGKVRRMETFGAFVEVADGLDGLLHISELSWTKRVDHPKEILKEDQVIDVKILGIDKEKRKISLGYKQTGDNPWDTVEQQYPRDELISCKINSVTKSGVFVSIDEKYEGFINMNDISWKFEKVKLKSMFTEGEFIDAKVLGYNKAKKRIELGLKQKSANPWEDIKINYGKGGVITGEIVKIAENGLFAKLNEEVDGFCHISQLATKRIENIEDHFKVGEKCKFIIQNIDEDSRKVSLSIRGFLTMEEKKDVEKYLNNSEIKHRISVGDFLKK